MKILYIYQGDILNSGFESNELGDMAKSNDVELIDKHPFNLEKYLTKVEFNSIDYDQYLFVGLDCGYLIWNPYLKGFYVEIKKRDNSFKLDNNHNWFMRDSYNVKEVVNQLSKINTYKNSYSNETYNSDTGYKVILQFPNHPKYPEQFLLYWDTVQVLQGMIYLGEPNFDAYMNHRANRRD